MAKPEVELARMATERKSTQTRMDPKTYAEHWEKESTLFESKGVYRRLSEITPKGNVLEIGSGIGLATLALAVSRKVLALDNNVHLVEIAQSRLAVAEVNAEIIVTDIFEPSSESVDAIKEFAPKVIVGWFLGSNADDQEKYVAVGVPLRERPKKYRENVEDAILSKSICHSSVEWVHLANRGGTISSATEAFIKEETKDDYDTHLFLRNGFEVVDVKIFDWDMADSNFKYEAAPNPNLLPGQTVAVLISILAKRKHS